MQPDSSQYGDGDNRLYRFDESGDPKGDSSSDEGDSESAASSQESSHPPLSEQEWQRLTEVARRCRSTGTTFEEFVVALVREFLSTRIADAATKSVVLDQMSLRIGQTLCGDPFSKQRLMDLRQTLQGMHHEG